MLGRWVDSLGVDLHCGVAPDRFLADASGNVTGLQMSDGTIYDVRHRGVLRRRAPSRRGGPPVGDRRRRARRHRRRRHAADESSSTSGRSVRWPSTGVGCTAWWHPGTRWRPRWPPGCRRRRRTEYRGSDLSTKLKLLGVDVASFGQSNAVRRRRRRARLQRPGQQGLPAARARRHDRCADRRRVRRRHVRLRTADGDHARSRHAARRPAGVRPAGVGAPARPGRSLPDAALLCSCNAVSVGTIRDAVGKGCADARRREVGHVRRHELRRLRSRGDDADPQRAHGRSASTCRTRSASTSTSPAASCTTSSVTTATARGPMSSQAHGRGRGCEICRPTVASILASLSSNGYVLGGDQASVQDTNDHHLANMQRNGTYSVVPRVPGGEITPGSADRARHDRQGLRPVHEDHRRPAHRPARGAAARPARRSGAG